MNTGVISAKTSTSPVVCPKCRGSFAFDASGAQCQTCGQSYAYEGRTLNLLEGEPFHDEADAARAVAEEKKETHTTTNFILPLVRKAAEKHNRPIRVLSVGCGVGRDVELINDAGFECYGIDCGSRYQVWSTRSAVDRLYMASATHMPFPDESFDFVFSGCVLAHIGVVGDTWETTPNYMEERGRFCSEVTRVTRKGGQIVLSGANRNFPFDLFHRDKGYIPRFHLPSEKFLVSYSDYRKMFVESCGCSKLSSLPVERYWGFNGLRKFFVGRIAEAVIKTHLRLVSSTTVPYLQRSFLNPWLVVSVEK